MSRIREALGKVEGERRTLSGSAPPAAPAPLSQRTQSAYVPPPAYDAPAYAESQAYEESPSYASSYPAPYEAAQPGVQPQAPAVLPFPTESLPGIPAEFHRELSSLRFTLESALADRTTRVVLFTAAVAGEGTTTVAANFARILAQDPTQSVLLVDANVRRPGLSLFFGLAEGPGLRELLHAGAAADFDSAIQAVERHNLHVLTALQAEGEGSHLFLPDPVRELWARHGRRYHWVVIDGPPVLEAPESPILGTTVDTSVFVIQAARTKRGVVQRAMEVCAKAGAPVLGAVLNRRRHDIPEFIYRRI
ncbi:MAG: CpsD/CapB family tyrosine-protein kinase [Candidatus Eiseniibacteriota bacterium]